MDEKGRLFGRINIIDLAVILFFCMLIPASYLGYNLATIESKKDRELFNVNIQVKFISLMPELAGSIKTGDFEKDMLGRKIGEIVSYKVTPQELAYRQKIAHVSKENESEIIENSDTIITTIPISNSTYDILATMKLMCYVKKNALYYGNEQPVKIGKEFIFSTDLYVITGLISNIKRDKDFSGG